MTEKTLKVGSYKVEDDPSIKQAGPLRVGEGVLPSRYVLRFVPESHDPWVTHLEVLDLFVTEQEGGRVVGVFKSRGFSQGNYFSNAKDAKEDFDKRAKF